MSNSNAYGPNAYGPINGFGGSGAISPYTSTIEWGFSQCSGGHRVLNNPDEARFIDGSIMVTCSDCGCNITMEEMPSGALLARVHEVIGLLMETGADEYSIGELAGVNDRFRTLLDEATSIKNAIELALEIAAKKKP